MADIFEEFPLKHRISTKGPSPAEKKFPEPGSPNRGPGYLGRSMSLKDFRVEEDHAPQYAKIQDPNVRK